MVNVIQGSSGDDNLIGTSQPDAIYGGEGRDFIQGLEGDDTLSGDAGKDFLDGGPGADTYLFGRGDGQDTVMSEWGGNPAQPDRLRFGAGITMADVLVTQDASDLVLSLAGSTDSVRIGNYFNVAEANRMQIGFADGSMWDAQAIHRKFMPMDDHLAVQPTGGGSQDGGLGNDVLMGADGDDTLYGDAGSDLLDGGPGADTYLFGRGDGQDTLMADVGASQDRLRFAAGINMADVDVSPESDTLVLRLKGSDDLVRIPHYFSLPDTTRLLIQFADGSAWDSQAIVRKLGVTPDLLYGTQANDVLDGGLGDDVIAGMDGDDLLYGDTGNDRLFGGLGHDTYLFGRGDGRDTIQGSGQELTGDQLVLAGQINVTDVDLHAEGSDLVLTIQDSADSLRVAGYFANAPADRPLIRFANGAAWDAMVVDRKLRDSTQDVYAKPGTSVIDGGMGDDHLQGDAGDNILYGDGGRDVLDGGSGLDTYLFGRGDGQDTIMPGYPDTPQQTDRLVFGANIGLADIAVKRLADDLLISILGTSDSVRISSYFSAPDAYRMAIQFADGSACDAVAINRKLTASDDSAIYGYPGINTLDGGLGNDIIIGTAADDTLYGDAGNDLLNGGPGVDTYWFGTGDGQDTIVTDWPGVMNLPDRLRLGHGITLADIHVRAQGADLLLSLPGGRDSVLLQGYFNQLETGRMRIQLADGTSLDAMSVNRRLAQTNISLGGLATNDQLDGGFGNDSLYGQDGDDVLYGAQGNDWLEGGLGSDTYLYGRGDGQDVIALGSNGNNNQGDADQLVLGQGITAADITVSRDSTNGANLQLSFKGSDDSIVVLGYFNSPWSNPFTVHFADGMVWDFAAVNRQFGDYSPGGAFNGTPGDDACEGGTGDDALYGQAGNDVLHGGAGNDYLDGGYGVDTYLFGRSDGSDVVVADMYGYGDPNDPDAPTDLLRLGAGIDAADVAVSAQSSDLILSLDGSTDQVRVSGYFNTPPAARMHIAFADGLQWDDAAISRLRYPSNDLLAGTPDCDALEGGLGNDTLQGLDGQDILSGGDGQDLLDGGTGADTLIGGAGDDTYIVDDINDVVVEKIEADGILSYDTIVSSVSCTAPDNVEAIILTSAANLNATANSTGTDLTGNVGNNDLKGSDYLDFIFGDAGADTLEGGGGDDYYYLTDNQDTVIEQKGGGLDQIWAYGDGIKMADNVERLYMKSYQALTAFGNEGKNYMMGNNRDNVMYGNGGDDTLSGLSGNDIFYGGQGNDSLIGAAGNDSYCFQRGDGADTIYDADGTAGNSDRLVFQGAINSTQVWLTRSSNDLVVSIIGTSDKVTISNWFAGAAFQIEAITAAGNNRTLSAGKVQNLVNAMSSFAPPPLGQTTLTPAYSSALGNVIASSWS